MGCMRPVGYVFETTGLAPSNGLSWMAFYYYLMMEAKHCVMINKTDSRYCPIRASCSVSHSCFVSSGLSNVVWNTMPLTSIWHILNVLHIVVYLEKLFSCIGALVPNLSYILPLLVWFDDFFYCPHSPGCLRIWAVIVLPCTPY
jgi:hypothetical protein